MSWPRRGLSAVLVALCTTLAVGCGGDSSGPSGSLSDPEGLEADMQALSEPFEAQVLQSFGSLSFAIGESPLTRAASFAAAMSPVRGVPRGGVATPTQAQALSALRPSLAIRPSFAVIPNDVRGNVYVYDPETDEYVLGEEDGPTNGVRFILYAINQLTDRPAEPLVEIGHADLLDESAGGTNRLRIVVEGTDDVTYANYLITATATTNSFEATASGFLTNGERRVDFSSEAAATSTNVSVDFELELDDPALETRYQATLATAGQNLVLTTNFRLTRGNETVVLTGTLTLSQSGEPLTVTANLSVTVNGGLFATITGTGTSGESVTYTVEGADGEPLTPAEQEVLERLLDLPASLAEAIEAIFHPAEGLLGSDYGVGL